MKCANGALLQNCARQVSVGVSTYIGTDATPQRRPFRAASGCTAGTEAAFCTVGFFLQMRSGQIECFPLIRRRKAAAAFAAWPRAPVRCS